MRNFQGMKVWKKNLHHKNVLEKNPIWEKKILEEVLKKGKSKFREKEIKQGPAGQRCVHEAHEAHVWSTYMKHMYEALVWSTCMKHIKHIKHIYSGCYVNSVKDLYI